MESWLLVEVGGSSAQTAWRDPSGRFWFTPGVVREPGRTMALACPGIIRDGRVLYATNLRWPDDADPSHELGLDQVGLVVNDAVAAALGESVLRAGDSPGLDLIYVSLGTGVGSAQVVDGVANNLDLNHRYVGGDIYCAGCRNTGCLNSVLCSGSLPDCLMREDQVVVARTLASALESFAVDARTLVVLAGGIMRRYPAIAAMVGGLIPNPTEITAAPAEAKSAAYAGLDCLVPGPSES